MAQITYPTKFFLGTTLINPKVYYRTIKAIIDNLNDITGGTSVLPISATTLSADTLTIAGRSTLDTIVEKHTASVINTTATATATEVATGYITSTSAAAVAITLPSAGELASELGATAGSSFEFIVDNSAGANTITVTLPASIAVVTPAITGGATLTVSTVNAVAIFRLVFISTSAAKIYRIA